MTKHICIAQGIRKTWALMTFLSHKSPVEDLKGEEDNNNNSNNKKKISFPLVDHAFTIQRTDWVGEE